MIPGKLFLYILHIAKESTGYRLSYILNIFLLNHYFFFSIQINHFTLLGYSLYSLQYKTLNFIMIPRCVCVCVWCFTPHFLILLPDVTIKVWVVFYNFNVKTVVVKMISVKIFLLMIYWLKVLHHLLWWFYKLNFSTKF